MNGDVLQYLKELPDECIDMVMTSPPYWSLRNYSVDGQIGLEPTFQKYVSRLCDVFDEIKRVLKKEGTIWVNLGDTYIGNGISRHRGYSDPKKQKVGEIDYDEPSAMNQTIPPKCLAQIPSRFAIEMCDRGWILRSEIIWHKPNAMPSSCRDRFTVDFEKVFMFSKNKRYYFEQQFEPHKNPKDVKYRQELRKNKNYQVKEPYKQNIPYSIQPRSKDIVEYRELPNIKDFSMFLNENRKKRGLTIEKIESIFESQAPHYWFNAESFPSVEDYKKLINLLELHNIYHKEMLTIYKKSSKKSTYEQGKNKRAVWSINTKPSSNKHIACYPEELCSIPILAGCPKNGVVLDPFFGSGVTGIVSLKNNRNFIGIEINPEYVQIAKEKIKSFLEQKTLLCNNVI